MFDLEVVEEPVKTALDVVTLAEMKRHLRIKNTSFDGDITDLIKEAVDKLDWVGGELNRCILPRTVVRYLERWPKKGVIRLPYPPLIEVQSVSYITGDSPPPAVDSGSYVVNATYIGEISLKSGSWPSVIEGPRAIAVRYRAGYETFPSALKRMVKILAAHYFENGEATINEPKQVMVNRQVLFGMEDLRAKFKIANSYDDWQ